MTGLDGHKGAAAGSRYLIVGQQLAFDNRSIVLHFQHPRRHPKQGVSGRWPQKFDCIVRRHRTGRMIGAIAFHQSISGSPVTVAIEQRADNAATQHAAEGFLPGLRMKVRYDFIALRKTLDVQPFVVGWATAKAGVVRCESILKTFFRHMKKIS